MTVVPRASRMNLLVRLIMPWRLPAWPALILPLAVNLNRFLQLDLVFILGISGSFSFGSVVMRDSACHLGRSRGQSGRIRALPVLCKGACGKRGFGYATPPQYTLTPIAFS